VLCSVCLACIDHTLTEPSLLYYYCFLRRRICYVFPAIHRLPQADEIAPAKGYLHCCMVPFRTAFPISLMQKRDEVLPHYNVRWVTTNDLCGIILWDATEKIDTKTIQEVLGKIVPNKI
jgi:hypothetical protein